MNTPETCDAMRQSFERWLANNPVGAMFEGNFREAYYAAYLSGFDHAKHEALTALENALGQKVADD